MLNRAHNLDFTSNAHQIGFRFDFAFLYRFDCNILTCFFVYLPESKKIQSNTLECISWIIIEYNIKKNSLLIALFRKYLDLVSWLCRIWNDKKNDGRWMSWARWKQSQFRLKNWHISFYLCRSFFRWLFIRTEPVLLMPLIILSIDDGGTAFCVTAPGCASSLSPITILTLLMILF